jgi:hypothetical protein
VHCIVELGSWGGGFGGFGGLWTPAEQSWDSVWLVIMTGSGGNSGNSGYGVIVCGEERRGGWKLEEEVARPSDRKMECRGLGIDCLFARVNNDQKIVGRYDARSR